MIKKLFSADSREGAFFRRIDWTAFWTATVISFLVYLVTLGPSVTLEDSGELAVAGDHLGVPHPPGYPIWTMCAFVFARLFDWVTFRGQPTPAWSISLMSGVFAALAAGFTAMLITRSASDMLRDAHEGDVDFKLSESDLLCWAGGVGGSLVFAFSPVMWSQATIVEVYTLNAFFLMWIFLLTYRWMRRPSDKILWLTAFVFGLGMTNYQVLLLAALPLVVVIFLRDIALFRDFLLVGIPVLLTAHVLQLGAEMPAVPGANGPAYPKFTPLLRTAVPSMALLVAGCVSAGLAVVAALVLNACRQAQARKAWMKPLAALSGQGACVVAGLAAFGAVLLFFASAGVKEVAVGANDAPLFAASVYTSVAGLIVLILALCLGGAYAYTGKLNDKSALTWLVPAGVMLLVLFFRLSAIPSAPMPQGYLGLPFDWTLPTVALAGALTVLFLLAATVPRGIFFAVPVAAVQIALFVMVRKGGMSGLTAPATWWFWWPILWNFVIIGMAWFMLPNGRSVSLTMLFAELGVAFYIYMPIVSDLRNPPMNWGYPRTWEGFKHAITRGQYEKLAPSDVFNKKFLFQLGTYFTDLRVQFTLIAATLGFLPFTLWSFKSGGRRVRAIYVAIGLYLLTCFFVLLSEFMGGEPLLRVDKLLIALILVLLLVGVVTIVFHQTEAFVARTWKAHNMSEGLTVGITLAGIAAVIGIFIAKGLIHALSSGTGEPGMGIKLAALALALLIMVALGAGWYFFRKFAEEKFDFRSDMDTVTQQWIIATSAGFLVMSVLMVVLANIKGDLQDAFIQKVKFVSSHGIFAIWIGYGLAFGLALGNRLLKATVRRGLLPAGLQAPLRVAMVCAGLLVAAIPVYENYTNEYLVFSMSGAEQNNHDYGWQFGNYQLRGADAVTEELEADEEPLPNPTFPAPMEPDAIFFGGTDPGRFVPTYMIYSAHVRPDVFLITQNALADNTYMSTMRDLYGNAIWIPTPDDSARAFQVYVEEVQSGKRPKNAALTIENGRVQVSGALGVMEINGILCDMIFAKNKARHAFYIEESYVINWMFPYLTPHGLIMKINPEPQPISPANVRDDMDFWDWYTRHLLRTPMFRRDLPAQKSFSKLRSAIAGLYASRGARAEAEKAFQEARTLYPVSPEANFRLIQEVLLTQARYVEAIDILDEYNRRDPNNERGFGFVDFIKRVRDTETKVRELTAKAQTSKSLSPEDAFALAIAYRDLGQNESAANYLNQLAAIPNLPAEKLFEIGCLLSSLKKNENAAAAMDGVMARLPPNTPAEKLLEIVRVYGEAGKADKMGPALSRYLQLRPNDWQAWLDMATLCAMKQQQQQMQFALQKALELGKGQALQRIQENSVLRQAAAPMLQQLMQQGPGGLPALGPVRGALSMQPRRPSRVWSLALAAGIVAAALALRLPRLDQRPMHGDEANQAVRTGLLLERGVYHYDPNDHHGPALYFAALPFCRATARTFAETDEWNYRLVPVAFSCLTLLLMLGLGATRDSGLFPNRAGLLAAALLTALSPAMVYYSRFFIQESMFVTFLTGMLVCAVRYVSARTSTPSSVLRPQSSVLRPPSSGPLPSAWAAGFGACAGLAVATKETVVLSFAAAALAALAACGFRRLLRAWRTRDALIALGVAAAVALLLFSSFGTYPRGVYDALFATVGAYLKRATAVPEHQHPWNFYLKILFWFKYGRGPVWSEAGLLLPALAAAAAAFWPRRAAAAQTRWVRFVAVYTLALTALYSAVPYKTPWCALSFLHGYILLAGAGVGAAVEALRRRPLAARAAGGAALALLLGLLAWRHSAQACRACFALPADPRNPYVYAHTGRDALNLVADVEAAARGASGYDTLIAFAVPTPDTWPMPWYLRKYRRVGYWTSVAEIPADLKPDVVVAAADQGDVADARFGQGKRASFYGIRPGVLLNVFVPEK